MKINKFAFVLAFVLMLSFASAAMGDSLTSYYNLDETSGTLVIDSLGLHNGTNSGSTHGVPGKINTAYSFDGNDKVSISSKILNNNKGTISFWMKTTYSGGATQTILSVGGEGETVNTNYFGIRIYNHNIEVNTETGNGVNHLITLDSLSNVNDGVFHHIVFTYDLGNYAYYRDGNLITSGSNFVHTDTTTHYSYIGCEFGEGQFFIGTLDEIAIFNEKLSTSYVKDLYNFNNGFPYPFNFIVLKNPGDNTLINNNNVLFNWSLENLQNINYTKLFLNDSLIYSNYSGYTTTYTYNYNLINDGVYNWNVISKVNDEQDNSSKFTFILDTQLPTLELYEPYTNYPFKIVGDTITLNWTVSDVHLDSCWYNYNGTNVSVNCNDNITNFTIDDIDNKNVTFYVNDTAGNLNSETKSWNYIISSTGENYQPYVTETSIQDFSINLSYDSSSWSGVSAKFNYKNINYTAIVSGSGDDISSTYSLNIPVASNITDINNFYWIVALTNSSGTYLYKSNARSQTVSQVNFRICNYSNNPQIIFKSFDLLNPTTSINATLKMAWTIKLANGGSIQLNRSFQDLTETNNSWAFCISPNSSNYTVSVDIVADATGFTPTTYYIVDTDYTSITQNVSLYLLNESDATLTEVQVRTTDNKRVKDAYVTVQRYDVGTDTYYTYAILKTDSQGSDLVYLKWYDDFYKFLATTNGGVTGEDGPKKISSSPEIVTVGSTRIYEYDLLKQIDYSLLFNNDTDNFVLTYSDPTGIPNKYCLNVINRKVTGDEIVCDTCAISTSATLYCNLATAGNGTFIASFYVTGSPPYFIDTLYKYVGAQNELFNAIGNDNATGLAILMSGVIVALFLITPALGVLGMLGGVVLSIALGFQPLDVVTFAGLVIVGLFVMWAVKK